MISQDSAPDHSGDEAIRARALRAIVANRVPGLHFPSHFLRIEWPEVAGDTARLTLADGPHCCDADGTVNISALGILADHALATPARVHAAPGARLATIHMHLQFTGTPVAGNLRAESRLLGRGEGAALRQSLSAATVYANGKPVCHARGEYVLLAPPPGVVLGPMPWERDGPPPAGPIGADDLDPHERAILKACDAALTKASPEAAFIQRLWGGIPHRTAQGARNRVAIGPHIGNRVGHVQGGILLGLAATSACSTAPPAMMLSNVSAWYIGPGRGTALKVRSRLVHAGRTMAVVRTEIKTADNEGVFLAVSHHIAGKRDEAL